MFSNDITENCETLKELLRGLPPSARGRAKIILVMSAVVVLEGFKAKP
jgi:hypothetical protein